MALENLVGIDVSKDSFTLAILSPKDGSLSTHTLSFNHKDLRRLPSLLDSPCRIAVESSGPYSSLLLGNLRRLGFKPLLINPLLIKRFSSSLSLRLTKTDPIDEKNNCPLPRLRPENRPKP
jgi:transposase